MDWMAGFCSDGMDSFSATEINKLAWHKIDHKGVLESADAVVYAVIEALSPDAASGSDEGNSFTVTKLDIVRNKKDSKDESEDGGKEVSCTTGDAAGAPGKDKEPKANAGSNGDKKNE